MALKINKNENFFAPILNNVLFHSQLCLNIKILKQKFFDWAIIGGGTIVPLSLKTKGNKKIFQARPIEKKNHK
jgi:hypothetical protein